MSQNRLFRYLVPLCSLLLLASCGRDEDPELLNDSDVLVSKQQLTSMNKRTPLTNANVGAKSLVRAVKNARAQKNRGKSMRVRRNPLDPNNPPPTTTVPWGLSYGEMPANFGTGFDLLIVESGWNHDVAALRAQMPNAKLIAYVSIAEISVYHPLYLDVVSKPFVIGPNPWWPALRLDIRSLEWQVMLRDQIIAPILAQGYDGILMDGFELPVWLEDWGDPIAYAGSKQALINFTNDLYDDRPGKDTLPPAPGKVKYIVTNGGWALGSDYPDTDYFLIESVFNGYNFSTGAYEPVRSEYEKNLILDFVSQTLAPRGIDALGLDYAADNDAPTRQQTCASLEGTGFQPNVSTIDLMGLDFDPCRENQP